MNENPYQTNPEPSGLEVWFGNSIAFVDNGSYTNNTKLNRYLNKLRLTSTTGVKFIEQIKRSQLYIKESSEDQYYYVDAGHRYRPDLIALEAYGNPVLYWIILSCNNLKSPLELTTGLTIRIPPLSSIVHDERVM